MPSKYRPYYPRRYNAQAQQPSYAQDFSGGQAIGKDLGGAIANIINQGKQDRIANQLLQQYYPDQGGSPLFDPSADPSTDLPESVAPEIGGTATEPTPGNFQGGAMELAYRQQAAKDQLAQENLQAQIADRQAKATNTGIYAKRAQPVPKGVTLPGGSASAWAGGGGQQGQPGARGSRAGTTKQPAYEPNSGDVENDDSTDNFNHIAQDFDNTYGQKGLFGKFVSNSNSVVRNQDGSYTLTDGKDPPTSLATIPASDAPMWLQRYNAARNKSGMPTLPAPEAIGSGQNPNSTAKPGTQANPVVAQSKLHVRSLPFGTYIYDPNTKQTYVKDKPSGQ